MDKVERDKDREREQHFLILRQTQCHKLQWKALKILILEQI